MNLFFKILISIILCVGLGALSGIVTSGEIETWYTTLNKPSFNPPNWLFGPAWTTLYTLMGISFGLLWNKASKMGIKLFKLSASRLFLVQFILNLAWSTIFFTWHQIALALVEIIILWVLILLTIIHFYRFHKLAGILLIPYILWVSFATVLTGSIFYLN